jgi:hypothetical protein
MTGQIAALARLLDCDGPIRVHRRGGLSDQGGSLVNVFELRIRGSSDPASLAAVREQLLVFPEVRDVRPTPWLDTVAVVCEGDRRAPATWAWTLQAAGYEVERTEEGWPLEREPDAAA